MKFLEKTLIVFLVLLLFSCKANIVAKENIKEIIESAQEGDTVVISEGIYENIAEIKIPSGVTIIGNKNVVLRRIKSSNNNSIFNLSNAHNVTIKNINIELLSNSMGIFIESSNTSRNIVLENINIFGNLQDDSIEKDAYSSTAISIKNVSNITIRNCLFKGTRGGIYLNKVENAEIINNILNSVNFGNIVVSNSNNLNVSNNKITQPGKGAKHFHPSGDGMTFGGINDKVIINNNYISDGYCYLIWVTGELLNSTISNNVFRSGSTSALNINDGNNINIISNKFDHNLGVGVLLSKNYKNIRIEGNEFYNDAILSTNKDAINVVAIDNFFYDNFASDRLVGLVGQINTQERNQITDRETLVSNIYIRDENNKRINHGDSYKLSGESMTFEIINNGGKKINFMGYPQIVLNDTIISKISRGPRKSGASYYKNFNISTVNQPNVLALDIGGTASFEINKTGKNIEEVVVNIPTTDKEYGPFFFYLSSEKQN
ncbi:right-handed parallel beta-helix repeat-containing protein [Lacinutrix mariniflava]|uniref:right-handed parallel beta-helix repeat-containing protein n=1 Tax=Lacinutrix mariniflava TaxID=342955 RepID=UPI000A7E0E9E|nr:right-handed parallel beta-helix repeat-containing protein [Lacinutrix mariniflava]